MTVEEVGEVKVGDLLLLSKDYKPPLINQPEFEDIISIMFLEKTFLFCACLVTLRNGDNKIICFDCSDLERM